MLLKKAHDKYRNGGGKEKAKRNYIENNEGIKKRVRKRYKEMDKFEKKKDKIRRSLDRYYRLKKKRERRRWVIIKEMNKLIFGDIEFGNSFMKVKKA